MINSHWHSDHVHGNLAFPDEERQGIEAGIRHRTERLAVETDAAKRRGLT